MIVYGRDGMVSGKYHTTTIEARGAGVSGRGTTHASSRTGKTIVRAGFVIRTVAFCIDMLLLVMVMGIIAAGVGIFLGYYTGFVEDIITSEGFDSLKEFIPYIRRIALSMLAFPPLYMILLTAVFGQTLGKMIVGIRVVRTDGSRVGLLISTLRFFCYIISGGLLCVGFLWVIWDENRQAWHDMLADTMVVRL
ncbi:MAG: RDD family protein [Deltaproteobacteria bacterium]|nr:RDD family protein [Candidatus Zymogenaceae bacterium]